MWDPESFRIMKQRINQLYGELPERCTDLSSLVIELPSAPRNVSRVMPRLQHKLPLVDAIHRTKEKFQNIISISNPEMKIDFLSEPCFFCFHYNNQHKKCIYYKRCKERFEDKTFSSVYEINEFAKEEVAYLTLLETWVWASMDRACEKDISNSVLAPPRDECEIERHRRLTNKEIRQHFEKIQSNKQLIQIHTHDFFRIVVGIVVVVYKDSVVIRTADEGDISLSFKCLKHISKYVKGHEPRIKGEET